MTTPAASHAASQLLAAFQHVTLAPHQSSGAGPVRALSVSGSLCRSGSLALEYQLSVELRALRFVPSTCRAQRCDELWRHTCFELFARRNRASAYCEFNFTPSGDWAAYAFDDYRVTPHDAAQRRIGVTMQTTGADRMQLCARVDLGAAFALDAAALELSSWQLNCAAVIEDNDGALSYWAVRHPRPQPDFHDPAGFAISLGGSAAGAATSGGQR